MTQGSTVVFWCLTEIDSRALEDNLNTCVLKCLDKVAHIPSSTL